MKKESYFSSSIPEEDSSYLVEQLVALVDRWLGTPCPVCGKVLCGHEILFSTALGMKDGPRCWSCLAATFQREPLELRDHLGAYVQRRDCYRAAWAAACRREHLEPAKYPTCLWPGGETTPGSLIESTPEPAEPFRHPDEDWDAGDMACGDLVLALRVRLNKLNPGSVLRVIARDSAAPEDLPAWCRLTGHRLLRTAHPEYLIQRKEG